MGWNCMSSLSLQLYSCPLTGAADVTVASGNRASLLFLAVSFPLASPPHNCPWLMAKLLQLFGGVTFAEADWQSGPGAHSMCGAGKQRWLRG